MPRISGPENFSAAHFNIAPDGVVTLNVLPITITNGGTGQTTAGAALTALGGAPLISPAFTGAPTGPTPATGDNSTAIATTAFVKAQGYVTSGGASGTYAPLVSPAFTGTPTAPTAAPGTNNIQIATTGFVATSFAPLASPAFSGTPSLPTGTIGVTQAAATNNTTLATTAYVKSQAYAPLASPGLSGVPTAPTPATGDNSTTLATTAYVKGQAYITSAPLASYLPLTGGTIYQAGTAATFVVKTDAAFDALARTQGARNWAFGSQFGGGGAGRFIIFDETAGVMHMMFDTTSNNLYGPTYINADLTITTNNQHLYGRDTGGTSQSMIGIGGDNRMKINFGNTLPVDAYGGWTFSGNVTTSILFRANGTNYTGGSDSTTARYSPNRITLKTVAGDDPNAGIIDYKGFDGSCLNIMGGGLTSGRNVKIYENLFVVTGGYKPGGGTWTDSSDIRTKEDVADYKAGLAEILGLRPVSYKKNGKAGSVRDGRVLIGLVADEARDVMPEMVGSMRARLDPEDTEDSDILTVDMTALPLAICNALREIDARLNRLEGAKTEGS